MATSGAARLAATSPVDLLAMTRNPLVARSLEHGIRAQADSRRWQASVGCRRKAEAAIHHHEGGSGPAVVLINGWTASGLVWPAAMVAELERGHRVVRIDNRGSGWSRHAPRPYTVGDMARDARDVIDRLGLDRPTVVGLSMGGMIAQELAMHWPSRVGRLVLLGTRPPSPEDVAPPARVTASLLSTPPKGMSLRTFLREGWATVAAPGFGRDHPEAVDEMARSIARRPTPRFAVLDQARALAAWHGAHRLRRIIVPTTVVHGAEDPLIPVHNGMRLAQLIPGAHYVELPDVGHLVPYEAPSRVAAIIADRF
ncbi:MAG: alpha/beta fold hydrolase [Ilumatobacteraceae bacterium]